jgi:ankyrin repeat protein
VLINAVSRGDNVNCGALEDPLPLDWAVMADSPEAVRALLEAGADPNARWESHGDRFPLEEAIEGQPMGTRGHRSEIIRLLLRYGADPNARWCPFESRGEQAPGIPGCESDMGVTPLMAAAGLDQFDTTYRLLDAGGDPTLQDGRGATALDYASGQAVFELLLAAQFPDVPTRRARALAYLSRNVWPGQAILGDLFLASAYTSSWLNPPPPPPPGSGGGDAPASAPLHERAQRAALLLSVGADPNQRFSKELDWTVLALSISRRDLQSTSVLLKSGADPNGRWCSPVAIPFNMAVSKAHPDCTRQRGITPLMSATMLGDVDMIRLLVESGADPTLRDWQNRTARDYAVENKRGK